MKIEVVDYNPSHVDEIMSRHPRPREARFSKMLVWGRWKEIWRKADMAFTLIADSEIVGCAGIVPLNNELGEAWAVLSSLMKKYPKAAFKATKTGLENIIKSYKLTKIQCFVEPDFNEAIHFMYHLGFFMKERGQFGPDGEEMLKFWRKC